MKPTTTEPLPVPSANLIGKVKDHTVYDTDFCIIACLYSRIYAKILYSLFRTTQDLLFVRYTCASVFAQQLKQHKQSSENEIIDQRH